MRDREQNAAKAATALKESESLLETWRRRKNLSINNVHLVVTVTRGQLEVDPDQTDPHVTGAVLLTEGVIAKLNQDIEVVIL